MAVQEAPAIDTPFTRLRERLDAVEGGTQPPGRFAQSLDAFEASVKRTAGPLGKIPFPFWVVLGLGLGFLLGTLYPQTGFMGQWVRNGIGFVADIAPLIIFFTLTPALVRMYSTASAGKFALYVVVGFILTTTLGGLFALLVSLIFFPFMTLTTGAHGFTDQFIGTAIATGEAMIVEPVFRAIWGALLMSILIHFGGGYHTGRNPMRLFLYPLWPFYWIYKKVGSPASTALQGIRRGTSRAWAPVRNLLHKVFRTVMDIYTLLGVHALSGIGRILKISMPFILFLLGIYMVTGLLDDLRAALGGIEGHWTPIQAYLISVGVLIVVTILWLLLVSLAVTAYTKFPLKRLFAKYIAVVYPFAWATSSSAAALPVNISTARDELGIRPAVRNFVLPIGATANLDGTMMAAVVGTVVAAKMVGYDVSVVDFMFAMIPLILITIGTPGVPGGLAVVASGIMAAILPLPPGTGEAFILIFVALLVGPNDMFRTAVNVLDNGMLALLLDKWWPERFAPGAEVNPWLPIGDTPHPIAPAGIGAGASGVVAMGAQGAMGEKD